MGHSPWAPNVTVMASTNVIIEGRGAVRAGDDYALHSAGPSPHPEKAVCTTQSVFVNGKQIHRQGDINSCSDVAGPDSTTVFAG